MRVIELDEVIDLDENKKALTFYTIYLKTFTLG